MSYLRIKVRDYWNFEFDTSGHDLLAEENLKCPCCNQIHLNNIYIYIIRRLDRAGLLPKDYKPVCCYCYTLKKFGLLDWKENLLDFIYYEETDILIMVFSINHEENKECFNLEVNIHEYSKWA